MSTEVLEQVKQEIDSKPRVERFEVPAFPADLAGDEIAIPTARPLVGEGDVFVESSLIAPISLRTRPFAENWNLVEDQSVRDIEEALRAEGWHFFYLVPDLRRTGMARGSENAMRKALTKVLQRAFAQGFNTVEIASCRTKRVSGIHRAEIVARLRHIQESPYLFVTNEEMRRRMSRVSARIGLVHLRPWHLGHNYREYKPF